MSVQNGRCVVTFNQNNSEVVKGVADYLRYAGEQRIKKWRRHVRMVGEWQLAWPGVTTALLCGQTLVWRSRGVCLSCRESLQCSMQSSCCRRSAATLHKQLDAEGALNVLQNCASRGGSAASVICVCDLCVCPPAHPLLSLPTDFPRPGNRSGELMTAEEFLCIVGYQSEQGGGKKMRGDYE